VEAVQGEKRATLNIGIGWRGLNEDVERFKDNLELTKLKNNQEGIDPDDAYSQVPYEKGFQFLLRIEREVFEVIYLFIYLYSLHYIILLTIFCVF
jgi:leukotriene-A4 hydrolase